MSGLTITNLAQQVQDLLDKTKQQNTNLAAWLGGSADGGPNNDGRYPFVDLGGREILVPSPASFSDMTSGPAALAVAARVASDLARDLAQGHADRANDQRILSEAGATVDKFIGDCVLAYWTTVTPESLHASLRAAEQLLASCERIYGERPDVFNAVGRHFEIGVALHTGKVAYGGMSQGEFTLVGDPVNLTFRLESLTRELGKNVLVSGDFVRELPEVRGLCKNHGVHRVKGRAQGVEVFSLNEFPGA